MLHPVTWSTIQPITTPSTTLSDPCESQRLASIQVSDRSRVDTTMSSRVHFKSSGFTPSVARTDNPSRQGTTGALNLDEHDRVPWASTISFQNSAMQSGQAILITPLQPACLAAAALSEPRPGSG